MLPKIAMIIIENKPNINKIKGTAIVNANPIPIPTAR
jgi:hypothetical protein